MGKSRKKSFNERIYSALKKVPKGRVTTYKALAKAAGTKAYRAVGQAMRCNPYAPIVPCHRVINSTGFVGQYSGKGGMKGKINLLKSEGIEINKQKKVDLRKYLYNLN